MNKRIINEMIPKAYDVLQNKKIAIAVDGKILRSFRGQISSFGAAVTMGSLIPAIAMFSDADKGKVDRTKLMKAIAQLGYQSEEGLFKIVKSNIEQKKENGLSRIDAEYSEKETVVNAAIALKLAMNLYELIEEKG